MLTPQLTAARGVAKTVVPIQEITAVALGAKAALRGRLPDHQGS
jgi:hypothetical protein